MKKINLDFIKQIGIASYFCRGFFLLLKRFCSRKNNYFTYNTTTQSKYFIHRFDPSATEIFMTNCFSDWGLEYFFLKSIKNRKNNVFLDVGCHTGYYSVLFQKYFKFIYGFEPSQRCIAVLSLVKDEYLHLNFHQNLISNVEGLAQVDDSETGWSFEKNNDGNLKNTTALQKITLDGFSKKNNITGVTGIKIDIDGNDLQVLKGAKELINQNRPSILIENYSPELLEICNYLNYKLFIFSCDPKKPYNMKFQKINNFFECWVKMSLMVPQEFSEKFENNVDFNGNIITGINKNKILRISNFE